MPSTTTLSHEQRMRLLSLLQTRLDGFNRDRSSHLQGQTQAEMAHQVLQQDADDACQRAGEHEVEAIVSDVDSVEFNEIRNALLRIHGQGFGLCVDCKAAIPFERLLVEPQALRCTLCQNLFERNTLP